MAKQRNPEASLSKLDEQIDSRRSDIRTDKLDMTYGEFANMYEAGELVVAPAYQRLFRWNPSQKSRFIESILLGIPTPALFVAETEDDAKKQAIAYYGRVVEMHETGIGSSPFQKAVAEFYDYKTTWSEGSYRRREALFEAAGLEMP